MLSLAKEAMSRFDRGNAQRTVTVILFDKFFDTPSRHLHDRFVLVSGAGPRASPSLVI